MIPKIIHLCWFGRGEYPNLTKMCIESWKKYLPDFRIMIWNEDNFDINSTDYTKEAYVRGKWAFVSDYVRLYALEKYGGIYMDTDVEVIKNFSELLDKGEYISSVLEGGLITAGLIAARPNHPFIIELKKMYTTGYFVNNDGSFEFCMNPLVFTKLAIRMYNINLTDLPFISKELVIYPMEYFMPYRKTLLRKDKYNHNNYYITENTYTIHHDMGSWNTESKYNWYKRSIARELIPMNLYLWLKRRKYKALLSSRSSKSD